MQLDCAVRSILNEFSLPLIMASSCPVTSWMVVSDVVATNTVESISSDAVKDLIFILPIA